jgi:hypothetical protein
MARLSLGENQDAPLDAARQAEVASARQVDAQPVHVVRPPAGRAGGMEAARRQQDVLTANSLGRAAQPQRHRPPSLVVAVPRRQGVGDLVQERVQKPLTRIDRLR